MGSQFIASRCAHIDTVGGNVLIRGNMPLVGSRYAYDEIASASGVDLTGRHLIEMPIIDNVGERWEFSAILRAFEADPGQYPESFWPWWQQSDYDPNWLQGTRVTSGGRSHPGSFVWRPFEGLPELGDPKLFLGKPGWDYAGFVDNVVYLLKTLSNVAVYVHCQLGADRTGAFHIGYLMRSQGLTLEEAMAKANGSTSAGGPNGDYVRLVEAYAKSLT